MSPGRPDPKAVYRGLWSARGAFPEARDVPNEPGVYAVWFSEKAWGQLRISPARQGLAYIGVGDPSLRRRYREEWRPKNSGRSSPRRTLGAVLAQELALVPRPRPDRDPDRGARYYVFGSDGEARLTTWLEEHATFACCTTDEARAGDVETDLIPACSPPMNLTKWPNPLRKALRDARRVMEAEATRS